MFAKEKFLSIKYVVAWAGCLIPIEQRTFSSWPDAVTMYEDNRDKLAVRVEEYTTQVRIKIVLPENKLNV